jgi:GT2 family glycosyltransferase
MSDAKASVIILVWNGMDYLEACLDSVLTQEFASFEVVVVDNGSCDGSTEFVAGHYPQVRLIRNERNLGFAVGNNIGLEAASGEILVLLNQDTQVHAGWLEALVGTFDDPTIGIAGCKLLYPGGTIQHAGGYEYGPRGESGHLGRYAQGDGGVDQLLDVEFVTAAALAISRTALERVGALDEGFSPAYYEDNDWCLRARRQGFRVVYQPLAVATHYESTSTDASRFSRSVAFHQGRVRFVLKHQTTEQLQREFGPAESAWLQTVNNRDELRAARRAYMNALLALPSLLAAKGISLGEGQVLAGLLMELISVTRSDLGSHAAPSPEGLGAFAGQPYSELLYQLREIQALQEQPFRSQVPVLGRLIVAFRSLWNSVAAKWHVRPIIQQQSAFNDLVATYLEELSRDLAETYWEFGLVLQRMAEQKEPRPTPPTEVPE